MKRRVDAYTISVAVFMLLYSLDLRALGIFSDLVVFAAPYAAALIAFLLASADAERGKVGARDFTRRLSLSSEGIKITLFAAAPTILLILAVSYLSALLLGSLGASDIPVPNEPLIPMLVNRALLPSLSEELLFRFVPLVIIAPYSPRLALVLSSVVFAFAHCSFFQIPFALLAGVIFMALDLAYESILPSFILHFLNNAASVLWIKTGARADLAVIFFAVLGTLGIASAILLTVKRRMLVEALRRSFKACECEYERSLSPLIIIVLGGVSALVNLF